MKTRRWCIGNSSTVWSPGGSVTELTRICATRDFYSFYKMQKTKRRLKKRNAIKARIKYHAHPKKWPTGGTLTIVDGHVS